MRRYFSQPWRLRLFRPTGPDTEDAGDSLAQTRCGKPAAVSDVTADDGTSGPSVPCCARLRTGAILRFPALIALSLTFFLGGCSWWDAVWGSAERPAPPIEGEAFTVPVALHDAYGRVRAGIDRCPSLHSLFWPNRMVADLDPNGAHARVAVVHGPDDRVVTLWGARLEPTGDGTKITVYHAAGTDSGTIAALMRRWAENRQAPRSGNYEFTDC